MNINNDSNYKLSTTALLTNVEPKIKVKDSEKFKSFLFLPKNNQRFFEGGLRLKGRYKRSFKNKPLISIITVVYNGAAHIEKTIQSVLFQNYDNVEYIIIDGGSSDETLDIIKKYDDSIDYWVSESDKGISDAFNKGIRCSSGDLIGLINADDYYEENVFEHVVKKYIKNLDLKELIIYGDTNKITSGGDKKVKNSSKLSWFISVPFSHCSSFLTRTYYKKYGLFDNNYKIGMDVDLLMRGLKRAHYLRINNFIATQRDGGVSDKGRLAGYKEYRKIANKHFGFLLSNLGYIIKLLIYYKNKVSR